MGGRVNNPWMHLEGFVDQTTRENYSLMYVLNTSCGPDTACDAASD